MHNRGTLHSQSSSITGASPSDCLVSYPGHLLEESYPSAEMQSVYCTAQADWAQNEQDLLDFASKIKTNSWTTFSNGHLHNNTLVLADQQKLIFYRPVRTLYAV